VLLARRVVSDGVDVHSRRTSSKKVAPAELRPFLDMAWRLTPWRQLSERKARMINAAAATTIYFRLHAIEVDADI